MFTPFVQETKMTESASASDSKACVLSYLSRVLEATSTLCLEANQEKTLKIDTETNGDLLIRRIAKELLQACHPYLIGSPLPQPLVELEEQRSCTIEELFDDEDDDDELRIPGWKRNRTDYLRSVLRALPSIALDAGAHICSSLVASKGGFPKDTAASAFILFSKWLPIAPQLAPLVSDLFHLDAFPCPLDYGVEVQDVGRSSDELQLLLAEAAHGICEFYAKRGEHSLMTKWWRWGHLFAMLLRLKDESDDVVMKDSIFDFQKAIRWHTARAIGYLIDLRPAAFAAYLDRLEVRETRVPWVPHPWILDQEAVRAQFRSLKNVVSLWDTEEDELRAVSAEQIRDVIPLHFMLVHVGKGIVFVKDRAFCDLSAENAMNEDHETHSVARRKHLILTPTTSRNLSLLGAAMCTDPHPPPILVCGPPGSGKSSLVRELAYYCCSSSASSNSYDLLELHVDEETDSKTLIGSYTSTDIPGEFSWRPGALTQAVRSGKWVLMEDVDTVPSEIQAAIVQLLENRMLPLGSGKYERCHPKFRLFGTCTTNADYHIGDENFEEKRSLRLSGRKLVTPSLWRKVHVQPLAFSELKEIGESLHPSLPPIVLEAALNVLKVLDRSGRSDVPEVENPTNDLAPSAETTTNSTPFRIATGRNASVRDFLKLLSRISHTVIFERNAAFVTESQRTLCLAETVDVFAASCPSLDQRKDFITTVAAPHWGITADLALNYVEARQPSIMRGVNHTEIGRAKIPNASHGRQVEVTSEKFAPTNFSKRLMESIGVCISENEPTLLVGETGCGKTTLLQQLARYADRELIVQNLSLQTDSTDLLGGYRPLEMSHIARKTYFDFVDIFVSTFSRKQNADFLKYASSVLEKGQWKKLAQCFRRAAALGLAKVKERNGVNKSMDAALPGLDDWKAFGERAEQFERQRLACDSGLAFAFTEGALVDAIRTGKWVLLDEINLASSETLQRLCGLLDDSTGSVTLTERGDADALKRHPDFRLFAAMNPATDAGKKDLPPSFRSRFSELYVDELIDAVELRTVAAQYLQGLVAVHHTPLEHTETIGRAVDIYLQCRDLAEQQLVDASGHKPRYTMRTMCRALSATRNLVVQRRMPLNRSILEGFELAFEGALDSTSTKTVQRVLRSHLGKELSRSDRDHPPRRPGGRDGNERYVLVKPFWLIAGPLDQVDWSEDPNPSRSKFILTESMSTNLRRLARAVAAGPWPVLLEGPTSAGKTTLVEYLAARCGHEVVRINNHEHTDVQEYTGGYSSDANGALSFRDGILVRALRRGHWVILDELNLAPSEVLEALNRLLDDNRELYLPEIDETVQPHRNFRLFATQNPSGAYGGRKPLSRAFRNRFVEIHMGDIPSEEMKTILEKRCSCPPSHAKALVKVMIALRQRRNVHGVFLGKDGLITPRDLLRWAERGGSSKLELAQEGYMLLAERLRNEEEKSIVREEIEAHLGVEVNCDDIYYGENSEAREILETSAHAQNRMTADKSFSLSSIAPTKSLLRLLTLVLRCVRQKEPVLLVGDTGCGKTTVVQLLRDVLQRDLHVLNCHATTETSDLIGGLRPVRRRGAIALEIRDKFQTFLSLYPDKEILRSLTLPEFLCLPDNSGIHCLGTNSVGDTDLPEDGVSIIMSLTEFLWGKFLECDKSPTASDAPVSKRAKKQKLTCGKSLNVDRNRDSEQHAPLKELVDEMLVLSRRMSSLFEWSDGPLVRAMRSGQMILLDEMSLAEDAVLERLNSVLEPSRTLVLAEKGADAVDGNESDSAVVTGHDDFRIFATMNPGGDFGKRELSPALRSRFTEIWVPPVTDPSDIEMVLGQTLVSAASRCDNEILKRTILNYVNWFNICVCGKTGNPCADLALSLRDVLAWARFIVDVSNSIEDMDVWALYCHGACLMHLDGLGLGTGLSNVDASTTKRLAMSFLLAELPDEDRKACLPTFESDSRVGLVTGRQFGLHPFTIPTGPNPVSESTFAFEAPTTSLNLLRVLRALQISKPILLEGSPGVGKTSLVSALAGASGHRLVRINLSEQTDISDLMGSDLPNPDCEDTNTINGSSFKWCDGVFLRAIKQGDWVLLDELNLASQSVLEGLNSCLDHRASVFIPELGKTFECPPTFRVFAAQNPLAQGGGRKGLPKSFLNRFTKVYVESLTEDDLHSILLSRFPAVPSTLSKSMIMFNNKVHGDVVEKHEYGDGGSPWEFNLRDVFRWCELVVASGDVTSDHVARFASHLYLQRFRSVEDRKRLNLCFQDYFGVDLVKLSVPELRVTEDFVCIGEASLERRIHSVGTASEQLFGHDSVVLRSLLWPLESVARCVTMKWPVLLVGQSGSGKSWLLKSLAELSNAPLINVSLTPATDVNELVGCFEQVDSDHDEKEAIQCFRLLHDGACKYLTESEEQLVLLQRISHLYHSIDDASPSEMSAIGFDLVTLFAAGARVSNKFHQHSQKHLETVRAALENMENTINHTVDQGKRHFRWVDGILVNAMTHGYWIHLENVNLCPASVLDRLNPVMEQDGELLLTECGVQDSGENKGASHRVVKQHPDFRIFLSMNPEHGEISRAMRNRCVEISLIPPSVHGLVDDTNSMSTTTTVDALDLLSSTGVRSSPLGMSMLKVHETEVASAWACGTELPSTRHLHEWGNLVSGFCTRGWDIQSTLALSLRLSYELNEDRTRRHFSEQLSFDDEVASFALAQSPLLRWGWSFHPHQARLDFELRPVKAFTGSECAPFKLSELLQTGLTEFVSVREHAVVSGSSDDITCNVQNQSIWFPMIRNNLLVMYLRKSSLSDLSARSGSLDGYEDTVSCYLRFMTFFLRNCISRLPQSSYDVGPEAAVNDGEFLNIGEHLSAQGDTFLTMHLNRMTQILREKIAYRRVAVLDQLSLGTSGLTVLEASMCLYYGKIERSLVSCPATPIIYPFFLALDDWIKHLNTAPECMQTMWHSFQLSLERLLSQRDQFWLYLNECSYHFVTPSSFLGFNESGFIVHWIWLKKKLHEFSGSSELLNSLQTSSVKKLKQRLVVLIETLDRLIFDTADDLSRSADTLWKKGGHPLVPRRADQWETIARLKEISWACSLFEGQVYNGGVGTNSRRVVDLGHLIHNNHPALFVSMKERGDLLAALCTCYWASTDEVRERCPSRDAVQDNQRLHAVISMQLSKQKQAFAAQVRALKVDLEITTVENLLDVEVLASLREGTGVHDGDTDQDFLQALLFRFAQIQVSPIAEFWCAREEAALIESLTKLLVTSTGSSILGKVIDLLPRLKNFIRVALSHTLLAVEELRPFQTLIWVASGSSESAESITHLLQCLLPRMMATISRHKWSSSFSDLSVISKELELPPLWVSDTTTTPEACVPSSSDTFHEGPPALHQQVNAQVMFRLVGSEISFMLSMGGKSTYATIENYTTRKKQAQTIMELLSSLELSPHEHKVPYELQYLVAHTLETLIDFFPDESGREILTALKNPRVLEGLDDDCVSDLLAKCDHPVFSDCVETIVSPLLSSLRSAFRGASRQENLALCWVYVGLLRMNLLVPCSPLDPGKKPIAKVLQLSRHLDELQGRLVAARFDSSLLQGVTTPRDPTYRRLTEEADRVIEKRSKQERKTVERTSEAPPFIDLYRESRQFLKAVAGTDGVPALICAIREAGQDPRENRAARNRELNWQTTASSFCSRMLDHFAPYEDVILPFVHAIQNVRDGIRVLANYHLLPNEPSAGLTMSTFETLLAFPSGNVFEHSKISELTSLLGALSTAQTSKLSDLRRCKLALSLAILCRIDIQKRSWVWKFEDSAVRSCHSVFQSITVAWTLERDGHKSELPGSEEDVFENEYREQFPNHNQEFHSLLHAIEVGDGSEEPKGGEIEVIELKSRTTEDQIQMLCCLHRDLFSQRHERVDDKTRARAFCAAYSAAFHLGQVKPLVSTTSSEDIEQIGGHIMALSLSSGFGSGRGILPDSSTVVDFHRDANPNEVAKASRPLEMLIARTSQLLTAFPGHSVLVALIRVADRVRKLPLSTTSLGKAMSGLAVILRKAQDWEQHASSLVKLGTPLQEVSRLVACWRKLELQSWATLLQARERRFANRARRHWPRLYGLLTQIDDQKASFSVQKDNDCFVQAPVWVWKGLKWNSMGRFVSSTMDHDVDGTLFDLTKVMDTFLLTSSLGEFQERLDLVETFATQISLMSMYDGFVDPWRAKVSRMLFSLWSFYSQFLPMVVLRLNELRRPIEARLRDEVKLAKWDEQSYYALAESSEKNHRKLMKLLREYDDVLELTVSSVLEKQLCHGVRSTESANDETCNAIPPHKMMFPFFEQIGDTGYIEGPIKSISVVLSGRVWTNPQALGLPCDKYVSQMDHYARRMASLVQKLGADRLTWSQVGAECASALSTNIFERIESLRKDKTTKPMKERALVDLFRTLRKNGYLQTKWSVPEQIRQMSHLLQLPRIEHGRGILTKEQSETLGNADKYYQRTTAEVIRLRSEVLMLGSRYMSQRETKIMLSLAEHGLVTLCQQRCVLSRLLTQMSTLDKLLEPFNSSFISLLPLGQTELQARLEEFNETFLSASENLKQLHFLMKMASPLVEKGNRTEAIRDMISVVESCLSSFQGYQVARVSQLLSSKVLSSVSDARAILEEVEECLSDCQRRCENEGGFPPSVFTSCISEIQRGLKFASLFAENALPRDEDGSVEVSRTMDRISSVLQKVLLVVQKLCKGGSAIDKSNEGEDPADQAIFVCHSSASRELAALDLEGVSEAFTAVIDDLRLMHDTNVTPKIQRDCCTAVVTDLSVLVRELLQLSRQRLAEYIIFSRSTAKLNYVLVRVFRVLVSKGYCADSITDVDGEGDVSGMNFKDDQDGTGMGEGNGKEDVTDQLESEEQLLGLKDEDQEDGDVNENKSKPLTEEEAKQGMEMEGDFEGDMCDVPEQTQDDDAPDGDGDEEELEREMGDGSDPNEEVIDEKMWDNSDDEGDQNQAEEKFEKDSGVKGEALEDELRTREHDEESPKGEADSDESKGVKPNETETMEPNDTEITDQNMQEEPQINEDTEDKYEDKTSGVHVRDEQREADEKEDDHDEPMQLDDELNLDENGDAESDQDCDGMDIDETPDEDLLDGEEVGSNVGVAAEEENSDGDSILSDVDADVLRTNGHNDDKNDEEMENESDDDGSDEAAMPEVDFSGNNNTPQDVQGISAKDGKDSVMETTEENEHGEDNDGQGDEDHSGNADESQQHASSGGTAGEGGDTGDRGESSQGAEMDHCEDAVDAPNPFRDPGDATKFWHKKLRMIEGGAVEAGEEEAKKPNENLEENEDRVGEFEYASKEQQSTTQVLGEVDEKEAAHLEEREEKEIDSEERSMNHTTQQETKGNISNERKQSKNVGTKSGTEPQRKPDEPEDESHADTDLDKEMEELEQEATVEEVANGIDNKDADDVGNRVVTDLSQMKIKNEVYALVVDDTMESIVEEEGQVGVSAADAAAARLRWSKIQGETHHLARRLCEKLRLVMEPLVATKLKGDYRTGKRINMKRVIGYIASGYRKDKIWLRRTKPAKRNYRVLLAVDNSESMHKSGAGEMALAAMATLAVGMSQLEIGELGVASFGEEMRLLHPFYQPFTSESGVNVVQNFPFDERRTRTALCVESALSALESQGDITAMQLVFLISDGRIERDSRDTLRRLVREMVERNVLLVMIIVEGTTNGSKRKEDSIVNMKEVSFENGKPKVKQFIEDYPFPYYMVLNDMQSLPEILGDALRQWFEMIAQIQSNSK